MIDQISSSPASLIKSIVPNENTGNGAADLGKQFGSFLNDAMANLNTGQAVVEQLNQSFVKGELSEVHQLTIASEKAALGLELTVQVRNRVVEAYQEIMRMQL
ncbi:flagellar hook-basal body complex protein FliE [Paenibacillus eucommiae]|uniref:Flagellar hook-basal body complex protein FliE n=1 Tax=Paenibacillus eucommiae TaxID=1355755 RepID=A0ABS4IUS3_9BACL|nr:flagellar hook-basal body complex protein FliE [Paenibacillus eucommiae]MBP1991342.1 flagellar hook-basal body complex protein FliE [Paenibacillus eucommiae]